MRLGVHRGSCFRVLPLAAALLVPAGPSTAQDQTVGLFLNHERSSEGYTLVGTKSNVPPSATYLIDNGGLVVNSWESDYLPGVMGYLTEDGHLVSARLVDPVPPRWPTSSGSGGRLEKHDWEGNLVWELEYSTDTVQQHHDIAVLPNGNVLLIAWEYKSQAEAVAMGRDPSRVTDEFWPLHIVEVRPTPPVGGEIVWEWHVWDHLIQELDPTKANFGEVADHPELVNINFPYQGGGADWVHANGIDYNAELDQIVVSAWYFSELWVIDHSTTTEEAAGHAGGNSGKGGDILYRWGNPRAYRRGTFGDQKLFRQHDAQWVATGYPGEGNFLVFDNGQGRPGGYYSEIDEIAPPVDEQGRYAISPGEAFEPVAPVWTYSAPQPGDFYSSLISGTERMPNGNTLICEGLSGHLFEVTADGELVWDYVNPVSGSGIVQQGNPAFDNSVFKVRRYSPDHLAFAGRDLTPGDPVEVFERPYPPSGHSLVVAAASPSGDLIDISWDSSSCATEGYNLLYGRVDEVAGMRVTGAECGLGISGTFRWVAAPPESLFFVVVGTDSTALYESSWGRDSAGEERGGTRASALCGATTKVVTSTCP
jgi:hypothetical protein